MGVYMSDMCDRVRDDLMIEFVTESNHNDLFSQTQIWGRWNFIVYAYVAYAHVRMFTECMYICRRIRILWYTQKHSRSCFTTDLVRASQQISFVLHSRSSEVDEMLQQIIKYVYVYIYTYILYMQVHVLMKCIRMSSLLVYTYVITYVCYHIVYISEAHVRAYTECTYICTRIRWLWYSQKHFRSCTLTDLRSIRWHVYILHVHMHV